jgi:hypothetical protein
MAVTVTGGRARKLYFDIPQTTVTSTEKKFFIPCTPGTFSGIFEAFSRGDRYGNLLEPMAALTRGARPAAKRLNTAHAWFECGFVENSSQNFFNFCLMFVSADGQPVKRTKTDGLPEGGSVFQGLDPVYTSLWGVQLSVGTDSGDYDLKGIVYVQRQHSIEV